MIWAFGVLTLVPWITGRVYRARRTEAMAYARRAAKAEAETEQRATEVLEIERRRIARELHDIIAHSLSLMVLQAGAASEVLDRSPNRAREALTTVQDTGRQALAEMKRLLSVLRTSDRGAGLQPQPGLADLQSLVDHVRDTGLDVRLTLDLDGVSPPPAIELSVYRVVQESLTNVIKHAAAHHSEVDVRAAADSIEVRIRDNGPETTIRNTGHGLIGMRERVALYHGDFSATSGPNGFSVSARFPLDGGGRMA